ncbi:MAG: polysaccharide deacetylase family protein [Clostridiales bacterium]|nr:polysaccharide deacetylase family protein [Clostridiales bacterium]
MKKIKKTEKPVSQVKKRVLKYALWCLALCVLAGCAPVATPVLQPTAAPDTPTAAPTPAPGIPTAAPTPVQTPSEAETPEAQKLLHATHEYGSPALLVDNSPETAVMILYPQLDIAEVDKIIAAWAQTLHDDTQREWDTQRQAQPDLEGELNVNYDTYLVSDRFVGVVLTGFLSSSAVAHPLDFYKTFNVDLQQKRLITTEELFPQSGRAGLLRLLRQKLLAYDANIGEIDGSYLENIAVRRDGVMVLLDRGMLASALGGIEVLLPYDEIEEYFTWPEAPAQGPLDVAAREPTPIPMSYEIVDPADFAKPVIALTFDDGPADYTLELLAILNDNGAKATFCMVGNRMANWKDTLRAVVAQGSEIIGHSWDHKKLTGLSTEQISQELTATNDAIFDATGMRPRFFRPPYGAVNDDVQATAGELGLSMVNWTIDTEDWKTRDADATYNAIMSGVGDKSIILCHDIHAQTIESMRRVIPALVDAGYQLVTISELFDACGVTPVAGKLYRHVGG